MTTQESGAAGGGSFAERLRAGAWAAPLPDFSQAVVRHRFRIGNHTFTIAISPIQHEVPLEPETDLIQIGIFYGNGSQPLTAYDLGLGEPDACANVWAYLINRINETIVQFYAPQPRDTGELNPRLGCWGPRPDLAQMGLADSDCAIAAVLGIGVWRKGANPPSNEQVLLEALRDTIVEAVTYWVVVAQRTAGPKDRRN